MAKRQPVEPRFLAKVDKTETCWLWTAWIERNGYGRFWLDGRQHGAHRVAYELYVGPIPQGMEIDHLCRVRHCVNPAHLEVVTARENVRRMAAVRVPYQASLTHCPSGHPYTDENTYRNPSGGRACLTCKKQRAREDYLRNREAVIERSRTWRDNNPERAREIARDAQRRQRTKKRKAA